MIEVEGAAGDIKLAFVEDPDGYRVELIELLVGEPGGS